MVKETEFPKLEKERSDEDGALHGEGKPGFYEQDLSHATVDDDQQTCLQCRTRHSWLGPNYGHSLLVRASEIGVLRRSGTSLEFRLYDMT
jgi:hypothetical protein